MEVRKVVANTNVDADRGKVALQYEPLIYCAEWADNNGKTSNIMVPANTEFTTRFKYELLNGLITLQAYVPVVDITNNGQNISTNTKVLTAKPYYAWANKGKGRNDRLVSYEGELCGVVGCGVG